MLFFLLSSGDLSGAELFGLKVQRFTFILLAIPVATTFVFANSIMLANGFRVYKEVYFKLTEAYFRNWHNSNLDELLLFSPGQVASPVHSDFFKPGVGRKIVDATGYADMTLLFVAPLTFVGYSYTYLFTTEAIPLAATVPSAALALVFLILGWLNAAVVLPFTDE
ncbi:MAG: hypothetical protein M3332_10925 [Actinomycetota bacterium]|nr:hypothetical protein [Actinomycetota bacterium]